MHKNNKPVRAVSLDAGGTLIEVWPSVGTVYAQVAAEHGCGQLAAEELEKRFARAWRAKQNFDYSPEAWSRLVDDTFAGLIPTPLKREHFHALYDRFSQPDSWRVFDDVRPALTALRNQGIKIAVVSNWDDRLRPLLADLHLGPFCQAIVISREVGYAKPAPEIFHHAAACLDLPPGQILHVGDSRVEDCEGGRAAGLQTLLLDRQRGLVGGEGVIGSLSEVPGRVGGGD